MGKLIENFTPDAKQNFASAAAQLVPGIIGLAQANKAKNKQEGYLTDIQNFKRQELVNPFAGIENPYANLSVATQAAKMQAEQSDIALANTLDTLRATGKSAGGATALAQAALKSKQNVSADIERQEAQNEKLKAQGQLQVDLYRAQGQQNVTKMQETRETAELDRLQGMADLEGARREKSMTSGVGALTKAGKGLMSGLIQPKLSALDPSSIGSGGVNESSLSNINDSFSKIGSMTDDEAFSSLDLSDIEDISEDPNIIRQAGKDYQALTGNYTPATVTNN